MSDRLVIRNVGDMWDAFQELREAEEQVQQAEARVRGGEEALASAQNLGRDPEFLADRLQCFKEALENRKAYRDHLRSIRVNWLESMK